MLGAVPEPALVCCWLEDLLGVVDAAVVVAGPVGRLAGFPVGGSTGGYSLR